MDGLNIMEKLREVKRRNFNPFMARLGDLEISGKHYPRLQMLTVEDILPGKRFDTPRAYGCGLSQPKLPLGDKPYLGHKGGQYA